MVNSNHLVVIILVQPKCRMDEEKHKEAERFIEEFKLMEFQVSLENMKREVVKIGDAHMYKDLYLIEKLLPTLVEGLEQLSREVENLMNDESSLSLI